MFQTPLFSIYQVWILIHHHPFVFLYISTISLIQLCKGREGQRVQFSGRVGSRGMGTLDLTVRVLDLSPRVTHSDLNMFFSYCGTIASIQMYRNNDHSQLAFVTFRQPYAYQTALLLNGALIAGRPIRILALQDSSTPPMSYTYTMNNEDQNNKSQGIIIPAMQSVVASKGIEILIGTMDKLEENYKVLEKGRALVQRTRSATEQTAGSRINIGSVILSNNEYISTGAFWLSGVLDKASKCAYELSTMKWDNPTPNSRNQK
ncbi:hypothetical protein F0562_034434 [Nyssa sinensis]|uniref:RRM domain-containing protein n=1 Tax=Nyssa sinensis TaxID=561372 RepID=A0A5J5AJK1_9ASTE|nr:hypothetical protein F0562_034434 [Nyssa sinensis]